MKRFRLLSLVLILFANSIFSQGGLFISEVAYPADNPAARFVELYNASIDTIFFSNKTIYLSYESNGTGIWYSVLLTGFVAPRSTYVIGASALSMLVNGMPAPDLESVGVINGDGNDTYALYEDGNHVTGNMFDIYGNIGVNGLGQDWEYTNSRAVRNPDIIYPSTIWTASDWVITPAWVVDCDPGTHSTLDFYPPVWLSSYPKPINIYETGFEIAAQLDELSTVYYVVLESTSPPPLVEEVKAGTGYLGEIPVEAGLFIADNAQIVYPISGLLQDVSYTVYLAAEDVAATPNIEPFVSSFEVTPRTPPTVIFYEDFSGGLNSFTRMSFSGIYDTWYYNVSGYAEIYPYTSTDEEIDDLFSPGFDLSDIESPSISFRAYQSNVIDDANHYLKLYYSEDYDGNPVNAQSSTWVELPFPLPEAGVWIDIDPIDVSFISGNAYFAFVYYYSDTYAKCGVDDFKLLGYPPINVPDLASLRNAVDYNRKYQIDGEVILTHQDSYRSTKFVEDATGAIQIDDPDGIISSAYSIGDGIVGLKGKLVDYNGMLELRPYADPGPASSNSNPVEPQILSISEYRNNFESYEAEFVKIEGVSFDDAGSTFQDGVDYITRVGLDSIDFRTQYYGVMSSIIPFMADIQGIALWRSTEPKIAPRISTDITEVLPEPNRTLVITEARIANTFNAYIEFTNMGPDVLDLHEFEFGQINAWNYPYAPNENAWMMVGEYIDNYVPTATPLLLPGESFWISTVGDFIREQDLEDPHSNWVPEDKDQQWDADIVLHFYEPPSGLSDSISQNYEIMSVNVGRDCWYLRHHLPIGYSEVVDQVGGVFDDPDGTNYDQAYDVAGVEDATFLTTLVRKASVTQGNADFANGRGLDANDSEWMTLRHLDNWTDISVGREMFWTVGNHGNYYLDETTLTSSSIDWDWTDNILNVPWGVHNKDSVMMKFNYSPGLAWHYQLAPNHEDSAYISARTGDVLTVWACGDDLDERVFQINLLPPTDSDNMIIPKAEKNTDGWYGDAHGSVFEVTDGVPGMDTILNVPFATRTDTILKYFEKAPNANWEFVWIDGTPRADILNGDILRMTAENGVVKDYFIDVLPHYPSHNAHLSSITWPDIPEQYMGLFGYKGDTIPNFIPHLFSFKATVPLDVDGIPSLLAKAEDVNASIEVDRAVNLYGSVAGQTVSFTVTAEDDTSVLVYNIQLIKEKNSDDIQPWIGEPFISQYVFQDQWNNGVIEICNPSTEPIDLSDYMIISNYGLDPVEMLTWNSDITDFDDRYVKYIPGYKWVSDAQWAITPGFCVQDLMVNPVVMPGDVFVLGTISNKDVVDNSIGDDWWLPAEMDIDFANNPWGEEINGLTIGRVWSSGSFFMWRILNDSIKLGLKAPNDPNDFELVETWSNFDGSEWIIGGRRANADNQTVTWIRRPEFYEPKAGHTESWGTQVDNGTKVTDGTSEWLTYDSYYGSLQAYTWPMSILFITTDIGQHYMNEVTDYQSIVTSFTYIVSQGFSMFEEIRGLTTNTSYEAFLSNINKKHIGQYLHILRDTDTLMLGDLILDGDSLLVISSDSINKTRYRLEVTTEGLSNDAVLTSAQYTVSEDVGYGTIEGIDYGTTLMSIIDNITLPSGARMDIIDENGLYVPLRYHLEGDIYDTTEVSDRIYLEVTAEDRISIITYQLVPNANSSDAFVVSNYYDVDSDAYTISTLIVETTVEVFLSNIEAVTGATVAVIDKNDMFRTTGYISLDDKLRVVSQDATVTVFYSLNYDIEEDLWPQITHGSDLEICFGETVNLAATGNFPGSFVITWNNGIQDGFDFVPDVSAEYIVTVSNDVGEDKDTIVVTVLDLPISNLDDINVCQGESTTLSGEGGSFYIWDNGVSDGVAFTPVSSKLYTVDFTGANLCMGTDDVLVSVFDLPVINAGIDLELCKGLSATLTATGEPGELWDNGVTDGEAFFPDVTMEYIASVTDAKGCSNKDTVLVTVIDSPLPTMDAGADQEVCEGESVTLTANSDSDFTWDNGITDNVGFIPATTLVYIATATNNDGCWNKDTVMVSVHPMPNIQPIDANGPLTFCAGLDVELSVAEEAGMTYQWLNDNFVIDNETATIFTGTSSGDYTVKIYTDKGCQIETDPVTVDAFPSVDAPTISVTGSLSFCEGDSVKLSVIDDSELIYQWKINGGAIGTDSSGYIAKTSGNYTLEMFNSSGCSAVSTNSVDVLVNSSPIDQTVNTNGLTAFCEGASVELNVADEVDMTYQWMEGETEISGEVSFKYAAISSGNYKLKISSLGDCIIETLPTTVLVYPVPNAQAIETDGNGSTCEGDSVKLSVTDDAELSYQWKLNGGVIGIDSSVYFTKISGIYTLEIVNSSNCITPSSNNIDVVVNSSPPVLTITVNGETTFCPGGKVDLIVESDPLLTYQWMKNGATIENEISPTITSDSSGNYSLNIANASGCMSETESVMISVHSLPAINAGDDKDVCKGESVSLTATGDGPISWDMDVVDGLAFIPWTNNEYHASTIDGNGCTNADTVVVSVNAIPAIDAGVDQGICLDEGVTLTATGEGFVWDDNVVDGTELFPEQTMDYRVSVTTVEGCSNADTVTVSVNPSYKFTETKIICEGVRLNWHGQELIETGMYSDNQTTMAGCDSIYTIDLTVSSNPTSFNITGEDIPAVGSVENYIVPLNADVTYGWDVIKGSVVQNEANNIAGILWEDETGPGAVYVVARNIHGCLSETSVLNVEVVWPDGVENSLGNTISIYPNPLTDKLTIELTEIQKELTVRILDITGKVISAENYYNSKLIELKMDSYTPGIYFINIRLEEENVTFKVVKEF